MEDKELSTKEKKLNKGSHIIVTQFESLLLQSWDDFALDVLVVKVKKVLPA